MTGYNLGTVVGANGTDGRGIRCIQKTSTTGNIDTYTIYYTDETTATFEVTNGEETDIVTAWETTPSDTKVPSEKLVKNTLDTKQATLVSGTNIKTINNNSLLGSGNIDIQGGSIDIVTSWETTLSDTKVPSEKLTKDTIDTKVDKVTGKGLSTEDYTSSEKSKLAGIETGANNYTHPTAKQCNYAPDLTNYLQKSQTSGLVKNDGSIDTTTYSATGHSHSISDVTSLQSALDGKASTSHTHDDRYYTETEVDGLLDDKLDSADYVVDSALSSSSTNPLQNKAINSALNGKADSSHTHSISDVTNLQTSLDAKVNTSDIANNLTTTSSGKVLDARQGKALADLIGDAIDYINL